MAQAHVKRALPSLIGGIFTAIVAFVLMLPSVLIAFVGSQAIAPPAPCKSNAPECSAGHDMARIGPNDGADSGPARAHLALVAQPTADPPVNRRKVPSAGRCRGCENSRLNCHPDGHESLPDFDVCDR